VKVNLAFEIFVHYSLIFLPKVVFNSSTGRGMIEWEITSPTLAATVIADSIAERIAATSPSITKETYPLPLLRHSIRSTFADFNAASAPSIKGVKPFVSKTPIDLIVALYSTL
jgi:hypothetical protein